MLPAGFLNKLANPEPSDRPRLQMSTSALAESREETVRWYLWDGGFFAVGRGDLVPPHAHHAVQIVIGVSAEFGIRGEGEWLFAPGVIVPPDVVHSFDGRPGTGAMMFVDPESSEGTWLRHALGGRITVLSAERLAPCLPELRTFIERPFESMEPVALIRHCVRTIVPGAPPARKMDPRITSVLDTIRASEDLRISAEDAAAQVFLSPGRFAHLFKEQVGLPFRRYILWRKLARAMVTIGRERTLADAAHAADFADAAHLTRTFNQMFGIPPSVMMKGEFFEIASPFT
jgi:AraC family transcriptional regulator